MTVVYACDMRHSRSVLTSRTAFIFVIALLFASPLSAKTPQSNVEERRDTITTSLGWRKVDAGPFSVFAPPGWEFRQVEGVDSYVGEFVGDGIVLRADLGKYSNPLKKERKPAYVVTHKYIGGRRAKIVSPKIAGHGVTGVYIANVGHSNALTLYGNDLTSTEQELVLKILDTLRFGGASPRYVVPPPPVKNVQ